MDRSTVVDDVSLFGVEVRDGASPVVKPDKREYSNTEA
jgi:hypothetical protein